MSMFPKVSPRIIHVRWLTVADPGFPVGGGAPSHWGGADLQHGCFLAKTHAKMKELDPVGGVCTGGAPLDPPMADIRMQNQLKLGGV